MGGTSGGSGSSYTKPITWKQLLPPWVQETQQRVLPQLVSAYESGGITPEEEKLLWGMARSEVQQGGDAARRALGSRMAGSGISPTSPVWAGEMANIESQVPVGVANAVANLAKLKIGAKDTATKNLLSALYTPPPYTTATQSTQSSGGGK